MKRAFSLLLMGSVLVSLAGGCGNSVDAVDAPTPTPTGTATPTPTGTPSSGHYSVTSPVPTVICDDGATGVGLTFQAPSGVDITVSGNTFTPDWGFANGVSFQVSDPEHGTISGDDFTANYTYCDFNGSITTKHVVSWTGTFNANGSFDSILRQRLRNATGNHLLDCGIDEDDPSVTTDMNACSDPGVAWDVHGEPD
jgi:hypothetical protein